MQSAMAVIKIRNVNSFPEVKFHPMVKPTTGTETPIGFI